MTTPNEKIRATFYLSAKLMKALRIVCAEEDRSQSEMVEEALLKVESIRLKHEGGITFTTHKQE